MVNQAYRVQGFKPGARMVKATFVVVLATMVLGVASGDDKAVQDEKQKLEGVWKPINVEVAGKPVPDDQRPAQIEFKGDRILGLGPEMTFAVDPSKRPRHIDLIAKVGGMDIKAPSIYELTDDELKLCIPLAEKGKPPELKRPEGFDAKKAPVILIRIKRIK
jgi:uncharacterized protein (TIGR03067 family)